MRKLVQHRLTWRPRSRRSSPYTLTFQNNGPSDSAGTAIVDVLPKGFTLESWTSSRGRHDAQSEYGERHFTHCRLPSEFSGLLLSNPSGAIRCLTTFTNRRNDHNQGRCRSKHPVINVTNQAAISATNCLADPNLANNTSSVTDVHHHHRVRPLGRAIRQGPVSDIQARIDSLLSIYL
ncbi:MAG: DUF11 domain-containing protein [Acidobacteria bacterium]|nr:DUF11 domain-containing protein [Acidobacteriota bacterium]